MKILAAASLPRLAGAPESPPFQITEIMAWALRHTNGSFMNLRSTDLNLLVILDALLTEKHVTRAGLKLGLSQPAVSNALSRLRDQFKDELLARTASGMELTPRAQALIEPTRQIMQQIKALFESDYQFDPRTAHRQFAVRMSDLTELLLLPTLLRRVREAAPKLSMNIMHLNAAQTAAALETGQLDMAISARLENVDTLSSVKVFQDRMVCVLSRHHPNADKPLTLERFLALDFLNVSITAGQHSLIDAQLNEIGCARRIALNIPHWFTAPNMLHALPYAIIMSERHALSLNDPQLVIHDLPLPIPDLSWTLYWHQRHDKSQAHAWLRDRIIETAKSLQHGDAALQGCAS
ncbi:LysR family transcriptional regulator [Chromobacterium sp. IIBBL 290-4]|uniref:LysR family transcriptional regulator n=1 Tax=Chromobacterium sp. IIBBL 290-4 TaxID=2953890 RepID=UPI0020B667E6|nr:LysR family transcriptional regulator [Chromobacterium sp. IIBBL 290-4]UTH72734.1 LysR family transcriptional regulator [Chromobacterium sp. IIBBL 290-4]